MCALGWNRALLTGLLVYSDKTLLTMALISGAHVSMSAIEQQDDILN